MRKTIWDASMGVATMNTAADGFTLTEREFRAIYNCRAGQRSLKTRKPYVKQTTTGLTGALRGAIAPVLNGKQYYLIALESAGATDVFISTGLAFSAVTASSGPYGSTSLTTPSTKVCTSVAANVLTFSGLTDMNWQTGQMVGYGGNDHGLAKGTTYYAKRATALTYSLHLTLEDAIAGTNKVAISSTPTESFFPSLGNAVTFSVVRETATGDPGGGAMYGTSGRDVVVISDGATVLVYDVAETGLKGKTAKHVTSWHPGFGKVRQEAGWDKFLSMAQANVKPYDSSGNTTSTDNTGHPDTSGTTLRTRFGAGTVTNDYSTFWYSTGAIVTGGKQFHILYDCPGDRYIWDRISVKLGQSVVASFSTGTWTLGTLTITKTGAFASYTFTAGDQFYLDSGTGLTPGYYNVASKVDSDSITVTATLGGGDTGTVVGEVVRFSTLYTPGTNNSPILTQADRGFYLASFPIDTNSVSASMTVKHVRFTYTYATSPAQTDVYWLGFMGGGSVQGGTLFRTSYYNSGSRAESVGVTCDEPKNALKSDFEIKLGRSTAFMGCQDSRNYIDVPVTPLIYFTYDVTFQSPADSDTQKGLDYLLLYARVPGAKTFLYCMSQTIGAYGGATWALSTINNGATNQVASGDVALIVSSLTLYARPAPDGLNMAIPPSKTMASVGGRLFCGDCLPQSGSASDTSSDVYFSEQDHPFRFRDIVAFNDVGVPDPSSGGRVVLPGEKVKALKPMVGDFVGVGTMLVFTDQNLHRMEGPDSFQLSRPQKVLPYGTLSPWSVASRQNTVIWLDHTGQVRVFGPGVSDTPSKDNFDDLTTGIPLHRLSEVTGHVYQDTYRMGYSHSLAAVNTRCMVLDLIHGSFVDDRPTTGGIQFGIFLETGRSLYNIDGTGILYLCEHPTATADTLSDGSSAPIIPVLVTRDVHDNGEHEFEFNNLYLLADPASGSAMNLYWTGRNTQIGYAPEVQVRSATYTSGTKTVTSTGAFTNYTFFAGDVFTVTAGTGLTPGDYVIASKSSSDAIVLVTSPGSSTTDLDGNIGSLYPVVGVSSTGVVWQSNTPGSGVKGVAAHATLSGQTGLGIVTGTEFFAIGCDIVEVKGWKVG